MMSWKWTWVNFIASLLLNRLRFLLDLVLTQLHAWITQQPEIHPPAWHLDFYVGSFVVALIFSALRSCCPLHYGVLLPTQPAVAHVLQDEHVVPVLQTPSQDLTRKVFDHCAQIKTLGAARQVQKYFPQVSTGSERIDLVDPHHLPCHGVHLDRPQVAAAGELCSQESCFFCVYALCFCRCCLNSDAWFRLSPPIV